MSEHALAERRELCATLRATAPDAPTLCGEWTAALLTAHMLQRERSIVEGLGRLPVRRWHERAERALAELVDRRPYLDLVDALEAGPPLWSPWSAPPVRELANLLEYAVHHEDVRRAGDGAAPRQLSTDRQQAIWQRLHGAARLTLRRAPVRVRLSAPGHGSAVIGARRPREVRVDGQPLELALVCFGRQAVARVEYRGEAADVAALRQARLGV